MRDVLERHVEQEADVVVVERVVDVEALLAVAHEALGAKEPQVVGASRLREPGYLGQVADAELVRLEQGRNQAQPAGVGEQPEGLREIERGSLGKRVSDLLELVGRGVLGLARLDASRGGSRTTATATAASPSKPAAASAAGLYQLGVGRVSRRFGPACRRGAGGVRTFFLATL